MKIYLGSNFDLGEAFEQGEIEVEEGITVRSLLTELSKRSKDADFIDPQTSEVDWSFFQICVNGVDHPFLLHRLDTQLNNGDKVEVTVSFLGGG